MHQGPLALLRMWLFYARPWQQVLICLVLLGTGVVLVVVTGHPAGIIPAVFGLLFLRRIVGERLDGITRRRR